MTLLGLPPYSGILFDFDGTLANTEPLHQKAFISFFREKGYFPGRKEPGKSILDIFREWGRDEGRPDEAEKYLREYLERIPEYFHEHSEDVDWFEDALSFLKANTLIPRAIVTGSFMAWLEAFESRLHITDYFKCFVTKEDLLPDREKPHPYAFQLGAERLGLSPEKCIAVEDSPSGITAAKGAGCITVAIQRGSDQDLTEADYIIRSLSELIPFPSHS